MLTPETENGKPINLSSLNTCVSVDQGETKNSPLENTLLKKSMLILSISFS